MRRQSRIAGRSVTRSFWLLCKVIHNISIFIIYYPNDDQLLCVQSDVINCTLTDLHGIVAVDNNL